MANPSERSKGAAQLWPVKSLLSASLGAAMVGVSVSTWWEWARTHPDFPKPIRISSRCTRWDRTEIEKWLDSRRVS